MKNSIQELPKDIIVGFIILITEFVTYFAAKGMSNLLNIPLVFISMLMLNVVIFTLIFTLFYRKKEYLISFGIGLIIILMYYISQYGGAISGVSLTGIFETGIMSYDDYNIIDAMVFYINIAFLLTVLFSILVVFIVAIFNATKIKEDFIKFFSKWYISIPKVLGYYIFSFALMIFIGTITSFIFPELSSSGVSSENQQFLEISIANASVIIMFAMICISGPLVEELVFRHAMIKRVLGFLNKYVAAILATCLFIFIHLAGQDFAGISEFIYLALGYFPVAITVNLVYAYEENIIYSTLIHMMNNFVSFVLILLSLHV